MHLAIITDVDKGDVFDAMVVRLVLDRGDDKFFDRLSFRRIIRGVRRRRRRPTTSARSGITTRAADTAPESTGGAATTVTPLTEVPVAL